MDIQEARVKTYYEILGVPLDAPPKLIREMYKDLAKLYHPDSNYYADLIQQAPSAEQVELFKIITTAYQTLIDPHKRVVYDDKVRPLLTGTFKKWEDSEEDIMEKKGSTRERKHTFGTLAKNTMLKELAEEHENPKFNPRATHVIKVSNRRKTAINPLVVIALCAALGIGSFVAYFTTSQTTQNAAANMANSDKSVKKNF